MGMQESFLPEERPYDPLPAPCPWCNCTRAAVLFRHGKITGLRCRSCDRGLDISIVQIIPLVRDCRCGARQKHDHGFLLPQYNNPDGTEQFCLLCGQTVQYVKKADLGIDVPEGRPVIPEPLKYRIRQEAGFKCQINHEVTELHMGHCVSVADARKLEIPDEITYDYWNLYATCKRCNEGLSGRGESVRPSLYIQLKPGEFDRPRKDRNLTFTKVLLALGDALLLRKEAA